MDCDVKAAIRLLRALEDPIRLAITRRLMAGAANVSELVELTGASQSKVSNHLALLRGAGVVAGERLGRRVTYTLANAEIAGVVEAIESACAAPLRRLEPIPDIALARCCYDHLAGKLGVALFRALVERKAIRAVTPSPGAPKVRSALGDVELGTQARAVFASLELDIDEVSAEPRRFAAACNDWTESLPHLGGALGAALQRRFLRLGWLRRRSGTRTLRITPIGRSAFSRHFAIDLRTCEP
jgi:DNA-binding transcriptional ArsR family regulator